MRKKSREKRACKGNGDDPATEIGKIRDFGNTEAKGSEYFKKHLELKKKITTRRKIRME